MRHHKFHQTEDKTLTYGSSDTVHEFYWHEWEEGAMTPFDSSIWQSAPRPEMLKKMLQKMVEYGLDPKGTHCSAVAMGLPIGDKPNVNPDPCPPPATSPES